MPRSAPADTRAWGCGGRDGCALRPSHKMSGDCCVGLCRAVLRLCWAELCCANAVLSWAVRTLSCANIELSCAVLTLCALLCFAVLSCPAARLHCCPGKAILHWGLGAAQKLLPSFFSPPCYSASSPHHSVSWWKDVSKKMRNFSFFITFPKSLFYSLPTPLLYIYMQVPLLYLTLHG